MIIIYILYYNPYDGHIGKNIKYNNYESILIKCVVSKNCRVHFFWGGRVLYISLWGPLKN